MYQYDTFDRQLVHERVADFREQTARYLAGELGRGSSSSPCGS